MNRIFSIILTAILVTTTGSLYAEQCFPYAWENDGPCDQAAACNPCDSVACNPCDPCGSDPCTLFKKSYGCGTGCGKKSCWDRIETFGWIQGGVYTNTRGNTTRRFDTQNFKGRTVSRMEPGSGNGAALVGNQSTDFQINQVWLGTKREANGKHGLDWGFAAEFLFGTDSWFSQSWGDASFDYGWQDGDYYSSIPQLYFQLAYGDWSLKLGKYETLLGGEAMRAPLFFFYSHAYSYNFIEPYSHAGALAEWNPGDKWSFAAGYTTGHDVGFQNRYDDHGFIGKAAYQLTKKLNLSYVFTFSRYGNNPTHASGDLRMFSNEDVFFHTLFATYNLTDRWTYTMQWDYTTAKLRDSKSHRIAYGIVNTLTYKINDHWGAGFRAEWFKDKDGVYINAFSGDIYEYTFGLNWTPYSNLSIRPEIRYDYSPNDYIFNEGTNRDQISGGVCAVVSF